MYLDELIGVITAWLAGQGLAQVVLGGHSLGGAAALATALAQPDRVAGLLVVSGGARLPVPPDLLELAQHDATAAPRGGDPLGAVAFVVRVYSRDASPPGAPWARDRAVRALAALPPGVLATDLAICAAVDLRPRLAEVSVPVLALVGSDDRMTPPELSEELVAGLPNATLHVLPGASHMALVETPQPVVAAMVAFLDRYF
jgi:pimeloyl-ACP methyl ester carboxylesterase